MKQLELEMIKAFARLEGGGYVISACGSFLFYSSGQGLEPYNPITDLALNCAARDKYEVNITYNRHEESQEVFISIGLGEVWVSDKLEIQKAVIECILKSKWLWK